MKLSLLWVVSTFVAKAIAATSIPVIDPTLMPSFPTVANVSKVDYSKTTYDRVVLEVDGKPFFYNGVQLRIDKLAAAWGLTLAQIGPLFQLAANTGFTVVNAQINWMSVQPDSYYNATESTYIRGGSYTQVNYAANTSNQIGYQSGSESNKELTYVKFDFSNYTIEHIDAAKVRFYINAPTSGVAFSANLYGISNNSWSASQLTWTNAPNHNGVNIAGINNTDYWLTGSNPSWDPINKASYYDFDASDFIINHCPDKIASFIFQPQVNNTNLTNGATLDGAKGARPPQLTVSSTQKWDFSYMDKVLGWAQDAGIKIEIVWFGSDSTSYTIDDRVPYFLYRYYLVEKIQSDGTVIPVMLKNQGAGYGIYGYLTDKNDLRLRAQEKTTLKALMNHIAVWNTANGNKKILIGVDVANENSVTHIHGVGSTPWHNPVTWAAYVNFTSQAAWVARTEWEYTINLANAVKESNYPVWTRCNTFTTAEDMNIAYNEQMRLITGTSLDFVGLDPYTTSTSVIYSYGHQQTVVGASNVNWAQGSNLPMVMENGGSYTNAEWLLLSTLAGGGFYNTYELMGPDNYGLYVPASVTAANFTPLARASYVTGVINTNNLLKLVGLDIATKKPNGAGGTKLVYFNPLNNNTLESANILSFPVTYGHATGGVGIGIVRSNVALIFISTRTGNFTIGNVTTYGVKAIESGYYNSNQNFVSDGTYPYTSSGNNITISVNQGTLVHVLFNNPFPLS